MPRKRKLSLSNPFTKTNDQTNNKQPHSAPFKRYPVSKIYRLLEPGPILLISTGSLTENTHNLMTLGFHMMLQHDTPSLLNICLGPWDTSFEKLSTTRTCVLAIPDVSIATAVVDIGNCSGDEVDKWTTFGLEALPAGKVEAPLVGGPGIIANVECVVHDDGMVEKYNLWVLKAVRAWVKEGFDEEGEEGKMKMRMFHHRGDGSFVVDGEVLDLKDRMVKWKQFQD